MHYALATIGAALSRTPMAESVMGMPSGSYDPETLHTLYVVVDAVWNDLNAANSSALSSAGAAKAKATITRNLLAAIDSGECDPDRLKLLAPEGLEVACRPQRHDEGEMLRLGWHSCSVTPA
ncbi:hypothetical protein SAMN05519103_04894 [Rhizobiales bacterium GAS113]|nr:hypothetical protein SAMN05519103_04894 [Rhizobiales bacterium GAS113]